MRVVRLLKVLAPLTCGLLLALSAGSVRGATETSESIPGPLSLDPAKFNEAQARAKEDDVEAKLFLGWMYDEGVGVARSLEDATNWWMKSADQGLATAQLVDKIMYADHPGSPASSGEGFKWWLATAEQTLAAASNNAAVTNAASTGTAADRDYAKAEGYRKAVDQGDVSALGELGWMYYSGRGVPQDKEKALQIWRKAGPQSGIARTRAERSGRLELIQQTGRDSARASLGLYVASHMTTLTTRSGGCIAGAVVDKLPDRILYIGEDGIPCKQLKIEDMSDETRKSLGLDQQKAQDYHLQQWDKTGVISDDDHRARNNISTLNEILADYRSGHRWDKESGFMCVDMANDVFNQVQTKGIPAELRVGNKDKVIKSIKEANHAWVMAEVSPEKWVALEPQLGRVIFLAENRHYYLGYNFKSPNDIKEHARLQLDYREAVEKYNRAVEVYNQTGGQDAFAVLRAREQDLKDFRDRLDALVLRR